MGVFNLMIHRSGKWGRKVAFRCFASLVSWHRVSVHWDFPWGPCQAQVAFLLAFSYEHQKRPSILPFRTEGMWHSLLHSVLPQLCSEWQILATLSARAESLSRYAGPLSPPRSLPWPFVQAACWFPLSSSLWIVSYTVFLLNCVSLTFFLSHASWKGMW